MTEPSRRRVESLGDLLRRLRRERAAATNEDVRPVDVARAIGVSKQRYVNYEMGIRRPPIGIYKRLALYFGIKLRDLGVDIEEMRPDDNGGGKGGPGALVPIPATPRPPMVGATPQPPKTRRKGRE